MNNNKILFSPSEESVALANMTQYVSYIEENLFYDQNSYEELHRWSCENPDLFWPSIIDFFEVKTSGDLSPTYEKLEFHPYCWFPHLKLNFAENLLKHSDSNDPAITFVHESGKRSQLKYNELHNEVLKIQNFLERKIQKGDVLAAFMPNCPETVVSMLGATSLGGVFTSTSCDFGVNGVVDRFSQSRPKVLVASTHYQYNGKTYDLRKTIETIVEKVDSIESVLLVDLLDLNESIEGEKYYQWQELKIESKKDLHFVQCEFSDPVYIMYSSGTTGRPKCIVHSVGGTLLQHVKELGLHTNLKEQETLFYFTTCGWMMWNWLVSSLFFKANVVLYEGSPGKPSLSEFFNIIDREKINHFGTSPKFLKALQDSQEKIDIQYDGLKSILSTGAPLLPEQFDFVYEKIKPDIFLSSICGGTDIIGCFMLGNPLKPVKRGEIQCLGLGMDVDSFDLNGNSLRNEEGELVCKKPFISNPIGFLHDEDNQKFQDSYFKKYPGVWHHGDYINITEEGGVIVKGRSDATLNPGGVRIGTAEIYRQTESLSEIIDSVCVGLKKNGDEEIILFLKLQDDVELTEDLILKVKTVIKSNTTPRHVPRQIIAVKDIPYTRSGKKMEMLVSKIINNEEITNIEAVSNSECLNDFPRNL